MFMLDKASHRLLKIIAPFCFSVYMLFKTGGIFFLVYSHPEMLHEILTGFLTLDLIWTKLRYSKSVVRVFLR